MQFTSFVSDTLATILGGILLAIFFFWVKEKWFGIPNILGKWFYQMETVNTDYNPYKGMTLRYVAILWREGNKVSGSIEKIYEISSTGVCEYVGENRARGTIEGYIEKKYFSKDKLYLHVIEKGKNRESTHYFDLILVTDYLIKGVFNSMIANQDGLTQWQRKPF